MPEPVMEPANDPTKSAALDKLKQSSIPKEPVAPVEPVAPIEPVVPIAPVEPLKVEPATPVEPVEPTEPVVPIEPAVPATDIKQGDFFSSASDLLSKAGLDTDSIVKRIEENNGVVTPELRAEMAAKLGESQTTILVSGLATELTNVQTAQTKEAEKVYEVVGGKEQWEKIAAWTATPESKLSEEAATEYNAMLSKGGVQAQLAAKALKEEYMSSPGFEQPENLMKGESTPAPTGVVEAISRAKYTAAKRKAVYENDAAAVATLEKQARYTMDKHPDMWRGARIDY